MSHPPYTDEEAAEARTWVNKYGPPNSWTAGMGTAARMIGRLLKERERLLLRWGLLSERAPDPGATVLVSRKGKVFCAVYREPDLADWVEGGPDRPWWVIAEPLSHRCFDAAAGDFWMPLPVAAEQRE